MIPSKAGGGKMELTRSEMEIMDVLWASEKPLSRADLLECKEGKSWKDSSVHILLNGLLQKQAIREAGFVKCKKTYGRTFLPTMTREEYFAATIYSHRNKPQIVPLIQALLSREDITPEEREAIKALVNK
jgi:BlaI family penicillinase repressor